jgi:putative tryptophan/tyrosine transport system substrate-binding protein
MRNRFVTLLFVLALSSPAEAQQPKKVPRIGLLTTGSSSSFANSLEVFSQGLRNLGYIEGQNIVIESRYSEGKLERLPDLAAELVRLKVDVIMAASTPGVLAAKNATSTIPLIFVSVADPIGSNLVKSLARPGGNITGMSTMNAGLSAKRLELIKETVPHVSRVSHDLTVQFTW